MDIFKLAISHMHGFINTGIPIPDDSCVFVIADRTPNALEEEMIKQEFFRIMKIQSVHEADHSWYEEMNRDCPCKGNEHLIGLSELDVFKIAMRKAGYPFHAAYSYINTTYI